MKLLDDGHKYDIPVEFAPGTLMSLNTPEYRSNLRKRIDEEKTRRHEVNAWWWKNVIVKTRSLQGFVPYPDGDLISLKQVSFRSQIPAK